MRFYRDFSASLRFGRNDTALLIHHKDIVVNLCRSAQSASSAFLCLHKELLIRVVRASHSRQRRIIKNLQKELNKQKRYAFKTHRF